MSLASPEREDLAATATLIADAAQQLASVTRPPVASSLGYGGTGWSDGSALDAVRIASELNRQSAAAVQLSVDHARASGHTWQEIGDLLGVSRQAAFQRFGRPVDPRTGQPMSNTMLPGAADRATNVLIDWIEGRYDQVLPLFNVAMARQLPPDKLAAAWAQVIGTVGSYERMGEALARQVGDYTIVDIPLTFEGGEMKGRVTYAQDGQVTGLFVLPPTAP